MEAKMPRLKQRSGFERFLNRYNHIMEFVRNISLYNSWITIDYFISFIQLTIYL